MGRDGSAAGPPGSCSTELEFRLGYRGEPMRRLIKPLPMSAAAVRIRQATAVTGMEPVNATEQAAQGFWYRIPSSVERRDWGANGQ